MEMDELMDIYHHFPEDQLWTIEIEDIFLSTIYAENMDFLEQLRYAQANKDYYIPIVDEVEELFETGGLISSKEYQDMLCFMMKELDVDKQDAEDTLLDLWDMISNRDDAHETMQWFWNQFEFESDKQVKKIVALYTPLMNSTRMLQNRGHKPTELFEKKVLVQETCLRLWQEVVMQLKC